MNSKLKVLVTAALLTLGSLGAAMAQFQPTSNSALQRPTYRAAVVALATAASATDFITISGSATKTVQVTRLECNGIASTAATPDIVVLKRSTANTTGTSTSPTATPLDSASPAATAVVKAYTVNPGALGTLIGNIGAVKLPLPLAATGADLTRTAMLGIGVGPMQPVTLRGAAQSVALNGNAATLGTGAALDCTAEWVEF